MLHIIVNLPHGVRGAPLPPRVSVFVFRQCSVDLVYGHIWTAVPSLRTAIAFSGGPNCIGIFLFVHCDVSPIANVTRSRISIFPPHIFRWSVHSSSSTHSEASLSQKLPRLRHLHSRFHLVISLPSYSKLSCSSTDMYFSKKKKKASEFPEQRLVFGHIR